MKIDDLIAQKGYKNNTVEICEFLGFTDTEQLKEARFFHRSKVIVPSPL